MKNMTNNSIHNDKENFVSQLRNFLATNESEKALDLFTKNKYDDIIDEVSWVIVPIVSSYLTLNTRNSEKKLFQCCKDILIIIAEKCNPSETILEFLEQAEYEDDDVKFCIILKVLNKILDKMSDKGKAIEWCISTIKSYVESLPVPENESQSLPDTIRFQDMDSITHRLINVKTAILAFLEPLVKDVVDTSNKTEKTITLSNYLLSLLVYLMGKPFCYLQNQCFELFKEDLTLPERTILFASSLNWDLLRFFPIIAVRNEKYKQFSGRNINTDTNQRSEVVLFESNESIPDLSYANFYFHIITNINLWEKVPQVYDPHYVLRVTIFLANCFLLRQNYVLVVKGLYLLTIILERVDKHSVGSEVLELDIYSELFTTISNIMIFNNNKNERQKAVNIFKNYINIFNIEARYILLAHLYKTTEHSGLLSIIIGMIKNCIVECLEYDPPCSCFLGNNLKSLLQAICKLSHGSATDLIEITDEIITTLNLLRFLFLRDHTGDIGIWNMVEVIENNYLKPLREGIILCRSHWKLKIKDLTEQSQPDAKTDEIVKSEVVDDTITILVGNEKLPPMPITEKLSFCYQALNGLDVMESTRNLWNTRVLLVKDTENAASENDKHNAEKIEDNNYEESVRKKILDASLQYVHELGWTQEAISNGAESIGYAGVVHGMFRNGGADLAHHFYSSCNSKLVKILQGNMSAEQTGSAETSKSEQEESQVYNALEIRLKMVIPYKKVWPQAIALMSLPQNATRSLANLLTLVDDVCYYTGDRSVNINWYTKRIVVAGVYKATELYMLQDNSADHQQTWQFLDRRIKDSVHLKKLLYVSDDPTSQQPNQALELATAAFATARNMLGLNWNR